MLRVCGACSHAGAQRQCAHCRSVAYCNVDCQRSEWRGHRDECARIGRIVSEHAGEPLGFANDPLFLATLEAERRFYACLNVLVEFDQANAGRYFTHRDHEALLAQRKTLDELRSHAFTRFYVALMQFIACSAFRPGVVDLADYFCSRTDRPGWITMFIAKPDTYPDPHSLRFRDTECDAELWISLSTSWEYIVKEGRKYGHDLSTAEGRATNRAQLAACGFIHVLEGEEDHVGRSYSKDGRTYTVVPLH